MSTDTDTFHFERRYGISPDTLWHLLTDPEQRATWGVPGPDMVLEMEKTNLREGGEEHHRCGPAEKPEFRVATRWYRLEAPALAVFTETLRDNDAVWATSLCTYRLEPTAEGVLFEVTVSVSSFTGPDTAADFKDGWTGGLANLDGLVASQNQNA